MTPAQKYAKFAESAERQIKANGCSATLTRKNSTFDHGVGGVTATGTPQTATVYMIFVPANSGKPELNSAFDNKATDSGGTLLNVRKAKVAAKGVSIIPQKGDTITANGIVYVVMGSTPIAPDGATPIIFDVGLEVPA